MALVVTYPEGHDGWWDGSVRTRAETYGYPVYPLAEERRILDYQVDYLLSVYYPNILDAELLDHPDQEAINLHQAELPRYRGSNVFTHAILNARDDDYWQYGTTMHVMAEEVDAGDVIDRRFVEIREDDTARSLYERTREASIDLFEATLPDLVAHEIQDRRTPQSVFDGPRYFYTKDSLEGRKEIDPERLADPEAATAVYDLIRALDFPPHKPAYTVLKGRTVFLTKTGYEDR
ncbi:methionyl-tRNA formyltransferase [Haloarcula brevis]|uniref:methionyl-tRNA formyltransferase n=1 Tax=Haloarcula brevis TaxID=3111453 RepID=UPI00300F526F